MSAHRAAAGEFNWSVRLTPATFQLGLSKTTIIDSSHPCVLPNQTIPLVVRTQRAMLLSTTLEVQSSFSPLLVMLP